MVSHCPLNNLITIQPIGQGLPGPSSRLTSIDGQYTSTPEQEENVVKDESLYAQAGVNIDKANELVKKIRPMVASTFKRGVLTEIGGFAGLFALDLDRYHEPVLVSSTDGVGTKIKIATLCNMHETIGIDLVAMCVNDILVCGATPLFFLDYFATGELDPEKATDIIKGITDGCKEADCSLIGGETAEMPGIYLTGTYDLVGFIVGVVEKRNIIDGSSISAGDLILELLLTSISTNCNSYASRRVSTRGSFASIFVSIIICSRRNLLPVTDFSSLVRFISPFVTFGFAFLNFCHCASSIRDIKNPKPSRLSAEGVKYLVLPFSINLSAISRQRFRTLRLPSFHVFSVVNDLMISVVLISSIRPKERISSAPKTPALSRISVSESLSFDDSLLVNV